MDDPYVGAPLSRDTTSHEFRLLELQPSELLGPIRCALRTYSFDSDPPAYTALSYTWGSMANPNVIELNGISFTVGHNLWSFLKEMRFQQQYHVYWIDAICIDQRNILERNHQVQLMRQIYSNANAVSIWLGSIDQFPYVKWGMEFLATGKSARSCTKNQARGIAELCSRDYWSRVWIIQEIMLGRNCTIHYCNLSVDIRRLVTLFGELRSSPTARLPRELLDSPAAIVVLAKFARSGAPNSISLMQLLERYRHQKATNILDKVYALHGLAPDSSAMIIDYGISAEELAVKLLHFAYLKIDLRVDIVERRRLLMNFGEMVAKMLNVEWSREDVRFKITVMDD